MVSEIVKPSMVAYHGHAHPGAPSIVGHVGKRRALIWSHLAYSNTSVDHGLSFSFSIFCSASNITLKRKTLVFLFNRAGFFFSFYMGFYIILFFFSFIDFEKSSSIIQIKFIDLEKN